MINLKKKKEQTKVAITTTAARSAALQEIVALDAETVRKRAALEKQRVEAHATAQKKRDAFETARRAYIESEEQCSKIVYGLDNLGFQTECSQNRISAALVRGCSPLVTEFHGEMLDQLQDLQRQQPEVIERRLGQNINTGTVIYKQFSNADQISSAVARVTQILQDEINRLRLAADQSEQSLEIEFQKLRASIPAITAPVVRDAA
jgi:hypothetical protein